MNPNPQEGQSSASSGEPDAEKLGTHEMGTPAAPASHPNNQKAALWGGADQQDNQNHQNPYLQCTPNTKKSNPSCPMESVLHEFNKWSVKAETTATNIWNNLKVGSSLKETALGKMNLTVKTISEGGFDALYKQTFSTDSIEILLKKFACYLATSTGPVAGTLYLSNLHLAFCSDMPLSFTDPSGQRTWNYYKILIPLGKISGVKPVTMTDYSMAKYLHVISVDGHEFWFMGFVNYDKASHYISDAVSIFPAAGAP